MENSKIVVNHYYLESTNFLEFLKNLEGKYGEWVKINLINYSNEANENPYNFPGLPFTIYHYKSRDLKRFNVLGNNKSAILQNLNIIKNVQ